MTHTRTQIVIIGAGPAGLVLGRLLQMLGVDTVVLEARDRAYVEKRVRAGVLEQGTVKLLRDAGVGQRMDAQGLAHDGIELRFDGAGHRIDFKALVGESITVYGQQEVVKDLIAARLAEGLPLEFGVSGVRVEDLADSPRVSYSRDGSTYTLDCDYVAGCDGFHGVCQQLVPVAGRTVYDRVYPFSWLGILADAQPTSHELIYAHSPAGFALHSQRSQQVVRNYLQVPPETDLADWPDERIWDELDARMALRDSDFELHRGPITEKGITAMRSRVQAPMRHHRLLLAGDAAHIVPPTGAKGMNLAIADVAVLADALDPAVRTGDGRLLDAYSDKAARRVWRAQHFSWWMTSMLHRFPAGHPEGDGYGLQLQLSQLRYLTSSEAAAQSLAENYVGLPLSNVAPAP